MRYRGRVRVSKIGFDGKKITGSLTAWKLKNPGKLCFDSKLEYECYVYMNSAKLKFDYQVNVSLFKGIQTTEFKKGKIKDVVQRAIAYTPDFYLHKYKIYIEVKGYADPLFKLRWKLFKLQGYSGYIVYSLDELKTLLNQLKKKKE